MSTHSVLGIDQVQRDRIHQILRETNGIHQILRETDGMFQEHAKYDQVSEELMNEERSIGSLAVMQETLLMLEMTRCLSPHPIHD